MKMRKKTHHQNGGWSRSEAMIIAGLVSFLGLIAASTLARQSDAASGMQCQSNLKRLLLGWQLYASDNLGELPPNGTGGSSGKTASEPSWAGGWLDFTSSFDNINTSLLLDQNTYPYSAYLANYLVANPLIFRCPDDTSTTVIFAREYRRTRSYSMNQWVGGGKRVYPDGPYRIYNKMEEIVRPRPANLWVMMGEHPNSINDASFWIEPLTLLGGPEAATSIDKPASYHAGGANMVFADGHVEWRIWQDERTSPESGFSEYASPGNMDIVRLVEESTALLPGTE